MLTSPFALGAAVFVLALGAGVLPLWLRFGQRTLHAVVAAASGLFLGITFLHLLPELAARDHTWKLWSCVLVGVLAVFLAEVMLRHDRDEHDEEHGGEHPAHHGGHRVVGIATFVGLSIHTLGGALALGLGRTDSELHATLAAATLVHKSAEAFSLASVLLLAELPRKAIARLLVAYALVTPAGIAIGRALMGVIPGDALDPATDIASGLAAGTFLYVAVAELLPEVFHGTADRGLKVVLILLGIAASTLAFARSGAG
jgi:zinc transporter ZupT